MARPSHPCGDDPFDVFMFKVITMSDNVVKEEMSFTFDYLVNQCNNEEDMQRLILSRDLNKLMEIT